MAVRESESIFLLKYICTAVFIPIEPCHNLLRGCRTDESLGESVVHVVEFCCGRGENIYSVKFLALFGCLITVFLRVLSRIIMLKAKELLPRMQQHKKAMRSVVILLKIES